MNTYLLMVEAVFYELKLYQIQPHNLEDQDLSQFLALSKAYNLMTPNAPRLKS